MKNVAIIGGGKEGLALLPVLKRSDAVRVVLIADRNSDALIFKLGELGYKLSDDLDIEVTPNIDRVRSRGDIDIVVDASGDDETHRALHSLDLGKVEIISPLSARLIWGHGSEKGRGDLVVAGTERNGLLSSLREIVDAVQLTGDKQELLSMILRIALTTTRSQRGSIMLLGKDDDSLTIEISEGIDDDIVKETRCPLGEGIAGKVAISGKPRLLSGEVSESRLDKRKSREAVKSALSVPLLARGKSIGVLNVASDRGSYAYTDEDLNFLAELASIAAAIILRSQEIEGLKKDSEGFLTLREVTGIMNSSIPLESKLLKISKTVSSHIDGECMIYTLDPDSGDLYLKASSAEGFSQSTYFKIKAREGLEGMALQRNEEMTLTGETSKGEKIVVRVCPLVSDGKSLGVIRLTYLSREDDEEDSLIEEILPILSEKVKDSFKEEKITLKATKLSAINEAGIKLISATDMKELADLAVSSAAMILEAEIAVLRLFDPGSGHFTIRAAYGMDDGDLRLSLFKLDKELATEVIGIGEPLLIPDLAKSGYGEEERVVQSAFCHPVMRNEEVIGTLSLYDKTSRDSFAPVPFNREDREIMERFITYTEKALDGLLSSEESRKLIGFDDLTSLPNAESISKRIKDELERSKRFGRNFTFVLMEVANFSSYVKAYGHHGGERLIREIAGILRDGVRAFDAVGRFWGSRFGLVLTESGNRGDEIVGRVLKGINRQTLDPEGLFAPERLKIVYGSAEYSGGDIAAEELIRKAAEELEKKRRELP